MKDKVVKLVEPLVEDRKVPRLPPFTTLEALTELHRRLRENPQPRMNNEEWAKYLARELRPFELIKGGKDD